MGTDARRRWSDVTRGELIGTSAAIRDLRDEVGRVARSDVKVLITGESGTGKELIAQAIHWRSPRADRPFVAVNCAGLPETLLESELFGHVKGSFTGAHRETAGKLEQAEQGTIFLDEIGEMTLRMQAALLRFLDSGEVQKIGADRLGAPINVRVVAATNRDVLSMVADGQFREDLYYRLQVVHLVVPPLRERPEDIRVLIDHFLEPLARHHDSPIAGIDADALALLAGYAWPGNVRELLHVIERLAVTARHQTVRPADLPPEVRATRAIAPRNGERRKSIADALYSRLKGGESFWTVVYPLYMQRDIARDDVKQLLRRGLEESRGSYKVLARMFNMGSDVDYRRFLNFLRKHHCQVPFTAYRGAGHQQFNSPPVARFSRTSES